MKATMEIPDELYRQVKAKSALEGRPVREVAIELFRHYLADALPAASTPIDMRTSQPRGRSRPSWFGRFREQAQKVDDHDIDSIRRSIGRGVAGERGL